MNSIQITQGHKQTKILGTNTVFFLALDAFKNKSANLKFIYALILTVADYKLQKPNPIRVKITAGRNFMDILTK